MKDTLNFIFWNCHGASIFFSLDVSQRKLLNNYSVIGIPETWEHRKLDSIRGFEDYNLVQREAVRDNLKGRASGGLILLIKKPWDTATIEISDFFVLIKMRNGNTQILVGLVYFKPNSVNECLLHLEYFFENNKEILNSYPLILAGDFNARIGDLNQAPQSEFFYSSDLFDTRWSLDQVENKCGRKLVNIMENYLFFVVNGRADSDSPAQFTFLGDRGASTIDLVWVNFKFLDFVVDMKVSDFIMTSDHLPVAVKTRFGSLRIIAEENTINCHKLFWIDSKEGAYHNVIQLSDRLKMFNPCHDVDLMFDNFIDTIRLTAEFLGMVKNVRAFDNYKNKPWFDLDCNRSKRNVRKLYRIAKKNKFSSEALENFLLEKKKHKNLLKFKKDLYFNKIRDNLTHVKHSSEFWSAVKFFRKRTVEKNHISTDNWISFLTNKYNGGPLIELFFQDAAHPYLDAEFSKTELLTVINSLKRKKSPGYDGVPYEFYKGLPDSGKDYMLAVFNRILAEEKIPVDWPKIKMFFLYKKGDRTDPENYRGIALINTVVKIFTRLLEMRITHWAENSGCLPECQTGFRKNRGCVDNIFVLHSAVFHQVELRRKKLYALFVDLASAFDSVSHSLLWFRLSQLGVSGRLIRIFSKLYGGANLVIGEKGMSESSIQVSRGVLQGDSASPLLFSLYVYDIEMYFRERGYCGVRIDKDNDIMMLLYADDMVFFADSLSDMRNKLKCLATYCKMLQLNVNTSKTKILPFHKGRIKRNPFLFYEDEKIEVVNTYRYLGVNFSASGSFGPFCKDLIKKAKGTTELMIGVLGRARSDFWESKMKLYDAAVLPSFMHGSEVWGFPCADAIEKAQLHFLKRILLLNKNTPNWLVRLETGRLKLVHLIFGKSLQWLIKILQMSESRYPLICYRRLVTGCLGKESNEKRTRRLNWVYMMKEWFERAGIDEVWGEEGFFLDKIILLKESVISNLAEYLYNADRHAAIGSSSCPGYKFLNPNFALGDQLNFKESFNKIRCITQLRSASINSIYLFIEGKSINIDCTMNCPICNLNAIETVAHFLLKCPMYNDIRRKFLNCFIKNIFSDDDKLMVLLSNFDIKKIRNLYFYTCSAIEIRTMICSVG